jgi:hypothetical protein
MSCSLNNANYQTSFYYNYAYNPSPSASGSFTNATGARNTLPSDQAISNEISAIQQQIYAAINQGVYETQVSNGTLMTYSTPFTPLTWTVSGSQITITNHPFNTGDIVTVSSTGSLPEPLTQSTYYYIIFVDTNTIMLASTFANAIAARPVPITLTNTGSGTFYIYAYYPSLDYYGAWQGTNLSNPLLSPPYNNQMNSVISYFSTLGYQVNRIVNTTTGNTLTWVIQW